MSLHYVLIALVIDDCLDADADDMGFDPDVAAENILDGLCQIEPKHFEGYTLLAQTDATPAALRWADRDQVLVDKYGLELNRVRVAEKEMT